MPFIIFAMMDSVMTRLVSGALWQVALIRLGLRTNHARVRRRCQKML